MTKKEKQLKEILKSFFERKGVTPPITRSKLEKKGYNVTPFLLELKDELKPFSNMPAIQAYFKACEKLI